MSEKQIEGITIKLDDVPAKEKFLVIELDELHSVPTVYYKGEEIKGKVSVKFEWETQKETPILDNPKIELQYTIKADDRPAVRTIGYNVDRGRQKKEAAFCSCVEHETVEVSDGERTVIKQCVTCGRVDYEGWFE